MTTEIVAPRSVGELLDLDTFQGMSDDEIQSIIDYRCEQAVRTAQTNEVLERLDAMHTETQARLATEQQQANELMQQIIERNKTIQFGVVGNE